MGVLADWQIRERGIVRPFSECEDRPGVISYGVTSYGYDVRVGYQFKVFTPNNCVVLNPMDLDTDVFVDVDITPDHKHKWRTVRRRTGTDATTLECRHCKLRLPIFDAERYPLCPGQSPPYVLIPPNSFALAETMEELSIPRDVLAVCVGKSTYARIGINVTPTPLEPEWEGTVTIEIANTTPLPAMVFGGMGIMQIVFLTADDATRFCEKSYKDKNGRYQNQKGITLPFVK